MEAPQQQLEAEANYQRKRANEHEVVAVEMTLKATAFESQVLPLRNQVKLLQGEVKGLKESNGLLEDTEAQMRVKMTEALDELHEKAGMFMGAEDAIAKAEGELARAKEKLETNTDLMYKYQQESTEYKNRNEVAERELADLTRINDELTANIAGMHIHERERELAWIDMQERTNAMQKKLEKAEEDLLVATTTELFALQQLAEE